MDENSQTSRDEATFTVKAGLAEMLKGGVIMDVVTPEQAKIAEDAGAAAVMALERVPADIRRDKYMCCRQPYMPHSQYIFCHIHPTLDVL